MKLNLAQRMKRSVEYRWQLFFFEFLLAEIASPFFWNFRKKKSGTKPLASNCKRVIVWNVDSPGDALWITPSLMAIRKGFPSAKVTLVCNKNVKELFELNSNIDHLVPIESKSFYGWTLFFPWQPSLKKLAEEEIDLMFILEAGSRPADHARIFYQKSKAKYCAATNVGILKDLTEYVAPKNRKENPRYWPDLYLDLVRHLGIEIEKAKIEISSSDSEKNKVGNWVNLQKKNHRFLIGIHPLVAIYARKTKQWPVSHYLKLINAIHSHGDSIFIISGAVDEKMECEEFVSRARAIIPDLNIINTAGQFNLREMKELISHYSLFITGDTSVLHVAAATQTPTVAIFGATNPDMIAPPSVKTFTIDLECRPCHQSKDRMPFWPTCKFNEPLCLNNLQPESVFEYAKTLLKKE